MYVDSQSDGADSLILNNPRQTDGSEIGKRCATDRAESADADIDMTRSKAFPAILKLRDPSYRKPID